jgi:leucyl aminopeptidase
LPDCLIPQSSAEAAIPILAVAPDGLTAIGRSLDPRTADWIAATGFAADAGATLLLPDGNGNLGTVLFGLGDSVGQGPSLLAGKLASLPAGTYRLGHGFADPALASLAFALGAYRYTRYRRQAQRGPRLVLPGDIDAAAVTAIADGVYLTRDLINTPANALGPAELADAAGEFARNHDARLTVIEASALLDMNFPLVHSVGAGAAPNRQPRLIDLTWGNPSHPKVTIVGKGVCFDSGGLDIKSSANMKLMKKDMGGAAHMLGLAQMVMAAQLPVRLRLLIPAVENSISGNAYRPLDVVRTRKGLSVEIGNTDAEGRVILSDALTEADRESPDLLIDCATLTGAARVALGPELPALFSNHDPSAESLIRHGQAERDPVWRLPLFKPYRRGLDSKVADLNNIWDSPFAGAITAALFLQEFVSPTTPWLHLDIMGWNTTSRPGRPEGGEAMGLRALYALVAERATRG